MIYAACGDWQTAVRHTDESRRHTRRCVATLLSGLSERDQLQFLAEYDRVSYSGALSLALAERTNPTIAAMSAAWVINGKSVVQDVLAERVIRARESTDPALKAIVAQLADTRSRSAASYRQPQARHVTLS